MPRNSRNIKKYNQVYVQIRLPNSLKGSHIIAGSKSSTKPEIKFPL